MDALDRILKKGYSIEIFRENGGYLVFVWPDVPYLERKDRELICSRNGKLIETVLEQAAIYIEENF